MIVVSCNRLEDKDHKEYYAIKSNYVEVTAIYNGMNDYKHGKYNDFRVLMIDCNASITSLCPSEIIVHEGSYMILRESADILRTNGFFEDISVGDSVKFLCAPELFANGYAIPIVAIYTEDKVYLDFETGWKQLMNRY